MSDATTPPDTGAETLLARFGSAKHPDRPAGHPRPDGVSDALVEAFGKLGEALESMEVQRGFLYSFHRQSGHTDLTLQDAVAKLRDAGAGELADDLEQTLVGRDVVKDRWTYQLVEDFDANYAEVFRAAEQHARARYGLEPHVHEAEMKVSEQQG